MSSTQPLSLLVSVSTSTAARAPELPPAAAGGLRSQFPDLVLGPRQPLDCRQLQQAGRRVSTRSFDTRSKVFIDLAALAIKLAVCGAAQAALRISRVVSDVQKLQSACSDANRQLLRLYGRGVTAGGTVTAGGAPVTAGGFGGSRRRHQQQLLLA
eukprot:scaffold89156_cov36-Phaeocystis_antarctica.AAC.1